MPRSESPTAQRLTVPVGGMTCSSCERRVGKALRKLPGVEDVEVSATRGSATLRGAHLPARDEIAAAIRSAGYEPAASPWLTRDTGVWRTVLLAAVVVAGLALLLSLVGIPDVVTGLADPSTGGLVVVLLLGLAAGVSTCMALIGGLVLGFSAAHAASLDEHDRAAQPFLTRMRPQLAFNAGRVVGFAVLGALLGGLGSSMSLPIRVTAVLVLLVALVMFLLGVRLTGLSPRLAAWSPRLPAALGRTLGIDSATERSYSHWRTALVGAATFFLPCGFTQAVQIYALSTASPVTGGAVMAVFALGTAPGLLALGAVPELTSGRRQVGVLRVVGVVVLAFALLNVSSGLQLLGVQGSATTAYGNTISDNVTVEGGVQTVRMTQVRDGYEPADTVLYAGMPTTWLIDAKSQLDCSAFLRVPSLGVSVDLTQGPNTIELPALEPGVVPFTCVMGMYSGNLVAIEPPDADAG